MQMYASEWTLVFITCPYGLEMKKKNILKAMTYGNTVFHGGGGDTAFPML